MMITTAMLLLAQAAATPPATAPANTPATRARIQAQAKANFDRMDSNRDGLVDGVEAQKAFAANASAAETRARSQRAAQFARWDSNKDNMLSKEEFEAGAAAGRRPAAPNVSRWMVATDKDKNGKVTLAELSDPQLAAFDRVDANRDGTISAAERQAALRRR